MTVRAELKRRAAVLGAIREFFSARDVVEVNTDLLYPCAPTDPFSRCLQAVAEGGGALGWLQPSPELSMKRLLAAGSGDIFQICKAFRADEQGPRHRTEFTLVEWYRLGMNHTILAEETVELVSRLIPGLSLAQCRYAELWQEHLMLDPFAFDPAELDARLVAEGKPAAPDGLSDRERRDLAFAELIEPRLDSGIVTVFDFPAEQTAMAQRCAEDPRWADRFEVFVNGIEIANGYVELTDPAAQRRAFGQDNRERADRGLPERRLDGALLAAMENPGLPACSGVALGLDRLLMVRDGRSSIDDR